MKLEDLCRGVVIDNRFKLETLLGSGSYGHVWKARVINDAEGALPEYVAIKVFLLSDSGDSFLFREAKTAKTFEHQRLVKVFGTARVEGLPIMWMEFVPGKNLQKLIGDADSPFPSPLETVLDWLEGIAEGLAHMHLQDPPVTHGDLKMDNVIVDPDRGVCLVDFGQSRQMRDIFIDTNGNGAYPYLAPEILGREVGGEGRRYEASDIYAAGVIAYRVLTGRFPRSTMQEVFNQVPFPTPRELNASVPEELNAIVMKCLAKKRRDRYQTGAELLAAIEDLKQSAAEDEAVLNVPRPEHVPAPAAADQLVLFAQELMQEGEFDAALSRLESGMQRMSTSPRLLLVYGEAAKRVGNYQAALYVYRRAVAWMEQNGCSMTERREAIEGLADSLVRLKSYDDAVPYFKELVEEWPDNRWYQYRYAISLGLACSDISIIKSIEILQKLNDEEPSALIVAKIGFAYLQQNQTNLACNYFNEALIYDQYEPTALYHLAYIRCVQGKKDKAMEYLRRLSEVDGVEDQTRKLAKMMGVELKDLEMVK